MPAVKTGMSSSPITAVRAPISGTMRSARSSSAARTRRLPASCPGGKSGHSGPGSSRPSVGVLRRGLARSKCGGLLHRVAWVSTRPCASARRVPAPNRASCWTPSRRLAPPRRSSAGHERVDEFLATTAAVHRHLVSRNATAALQVLRTMTCRPLVGRQTLHDLCRRFPVSFGFPPSSPCAVPQARSVAL